MGQSALELSKSMRVSKCQSTHHHRLRRVTQEGFVRWTSRRNASLLAGTCGAREMGETLRRVRKSPNSANISPRKVVTGGGVADSLNLPTTSSSANSFAPGDRFFPSVSARCAGP